MISSMIVKELFCVALTLLVCIVLSVPLQDKVGVGIVVKTVMIL